MSIDEVMDIYRGATPRIVVRHLGLPTSEKEAYGAYVAFLDEEGKNAGGGFVIVMEDVVIHPHHRGQGFGTMLVDHVIEFAKQKGFLRITLLTDRISAESQEFFKKQGFDYSNMIPMRCLIE